MRIIIINRDKAAADAFSWRFRDLPEVETVLGAFEQLPLFDCVATAGNCFGLMDAGMDLAVVRFFGRYVMDEIQRRILRDYLGEQPVGTSFIVGTGHPVHPFVAHTPTMRVPMNIDGTDNVYLAAWATLLAVHHHNRNDGQKIGSLVMPGFGTGTGGVDPLEASLQMRLACEHFLRPPEHINPSLAQMRYEKVHYGGRWGLEHPRQQIT